MLQRPLGIPTKGTSGVPQGGAEFTQKTRRGGKNGVQVNIRLGKSFKKKSDGGATRKKENSVHTNVRVSPW